MKAMVYQRYGSPDVLQLQEIDKPTPTEDEVLVKVHAASINAWDWELLMGRTLFARIAGGLLKPKHHILGVDIAGRVENVGKNVLQFQPGDEVFGDISGCHWGGFAEYVCADEHALALKSKRMSFDEAAAVPQAAVLALQSLHYKGQIQKGQKVLINGAGGGVGTFAVQIAKLMGAEVTGVDSMKKLDMLRSIGADHVVDYTLGDVTGNEQQYDRILDVVGTHSLFDHKRILNPKGVYVMIGGPTARIFQMMLLGPWLSMTTNKKLGTLMHKPNKEDLNEMKELFESGKLAPIIDKRYTLREVPEAIQYLGEGHVQGKAIITVKQNNLE